MSEDSEKQDASQFPPPPQVVTGGGAIRLGIDTGGTATFEVIPRARIVLDLPMEAAQALRDLINKTGDDPVVLFRKALGLYKLAEEAKREGKFVGIAATPDSLETEFVGL